MELDIVFADAHCHSNPVEGFGAEEICKKFKDLGGWFIALIGLPPTHYGLNLSLTDFLKAHRIAVEECKRARKLGMRVSCLIGFHPAEVDKLVNRKGMKLEKVIELAEVLLNNVISLFKEGLVDGIAEVGRPHYRTEPQFIVASELIMNKALQYAKDWGLLVHLHLEQGGLVTVLDIKNRIEYIDISVNKVLLHHVRPGTAEFAIKFNLNISIPALEPLVRIATTKYPPKYVFESDFIDDPKRPGVVIEPWNLALNQLKVFKKGIVNEDYLWKINVDNIVNLYEVEPP